MELIAAIKPRKEKVLALIDVLAALAVMALGVTIMMGWFLQKEILCRLLNGFPQIAFNTALSFFFIGLGLLFLPTRFKWVVFTTCSFVVLLNFLTLCEYLFHLDLYIDNLFYAHNKSRIITYQPRTTLNMSLTFFAGAGTLILLSFKRNKVLILSSIVLSSISLSIPTVSILGYFMGVESTVPLLGNQDMTLPSVLGGLIFGVAIVINAITNCLGTTIKIYAISLAVAINGLIPSVGLLKIFQVRKVVTSRAEAELISNEMRSLFQATLQSNVIEALDRFVRRWEVANGFADKLWEVDSENYIDNIESLDSLTLFDAQGKMIKNTSFLNLQLDDQLLNSQSIERLKSGESVTTFNPLTDKVDIFLPYHIMGSYGGFMLAVIDPNTIFQEAIVELDYPDYNLILSKNRFILDTWIASDLPPVGLPIQTTITPNTVPFTLQTYVLPTSMGRAWSIGEIYVTSLGLLATILMAILIYFFFTLKERSGVLGILKKDLEVAKNKANEAARTKSTFLSSMSHEIRTPLNAVIGTIQIMEESGLNELQQKYMRRIDFSSKILLSLVNDILDFSKIESGNIEFKHENFELIRLIDEVSQAMIMKSVGKNVMLYLDLPEQPIPEIMGDAHRIEQVLINLITNAYKFTEKGEIVLKLNVKQMNPNTMLAYFEVIDTGMGISEANQKKLFQRFSQVNIGAAKNPGGVGLGLSICRGLIEKMSGQIGVNSSEGQGSTFWFELNFQISKPDQAPGQNHLENFTTLLINPNTRQNDYIFKYLKAWGVNVVTEYSDDLSQIGLIIVAVDQGEHIEKLKDKNIPILYLDNANPAQMGENLIPLPISPKSLWDTIQKKRGQ